ncbi:MAG: 2-C-methyl-D-erythritol 4-phosphate cytidylyltransferase [Gemmatimonadota bacterium]
MTDERIGVVIPAAGEGRRMGGVRKPFLKLRGAPVLQLAMSPFLAHPAVVRVAVALSVDVLTQPPEWLASIDPRVRLVEGGETRFRSVLHGLEALGDEADVVMIHDAARPLVTKAMIERCLSARVMEEGVVVGRPVTDTLKQVDEMGRIESTPDRSRIWRAETPQAFPLGSLLRAYRAAAARGGSFTDDAAVFAAAGGVVRMVDGRAPNLKVTHPEDLALAELIWTGAREEHGS